MEGADVRAWVDHGREDRPAEGGPRGQGERRGRGSSSRRSTSLGGASAAAGGRRRHRRRHDISDKEWKELGEGPRQAARLRRPAARSAASSRTHGAIPPYENSALGDPPMPPGGERDTTSWHYSVRQLGRDRPQLRAATRSRSSSRSDRTWSRARLQHDLAGRRTTTTTCTSTLGGGASAAPALAAARPARCRTRSSRSSSSTGTRRRRSGSARGFVGGAGGIPFGPPDPQVADAMCQVLDRMNVSPQGAPRGVGDGDRRVRREGARLGRPRLPRARSSSGRRRAGGRPSRSATRTTRRRSSCARPRRSSTATPTPGVLAQKVQGSDLPGALRPARRAGRGAQRQVLRLMRRGLGMCGWSSAWRSPAAAAAPTSEPRAPAPGRRRPGRAPPERDAAAARLRGRARERALAAARSASSTSPTASASRRGGWTSTASSGSTQLRWSGWGSAARRPAAARCGR